MHTQTPLLPPPPTKILSCILCREVKRKCDLSSERSRCSRCEKRNLPCRPQVLAPRRTRIDKLQERALAIEAKLTSLTIAHDRQLLSNSLVHKIQSLNYSSDSCHEYPEPMLPIFPYIIPSLPGNRSHGDVFTKETEETVVGYNPVIRRTMLNNLFAGWDPRFKSPEAVFTLYLVRLFLPFRSHVHFYMDLPYFFHQLSRPPDDPKSVHPALLNAMSVSACCVVGGRLGHFKRYFINQTRAALQQSLESVDRLMHFLWASVVYGSFLTNTAQLGQAYATISACAQFAFACGLDGITMLKRTSAPEQPLLPPPADEDEEKDRINLAHAIYMADRSLAMISGYPSVFSTSSAILDFPPPSTASSPSDGVCSEQSVETAVEGPGKELCELLHSSFPLKVKGMQLYERVERFAYEKEIFNKDHDPDEVAADFAALEAALRSFHEQLPSLLDSYDTEPFEGLSLINIYLVVAHTTYHGSVLLLHSLSAAEDSRSRACVFDAARSLTELCAQFRGNDGLQRVRGFIIPLVHVINAARVFASYLRGPGLKSGSRRVAICCESLEILSEYALDIVRMYPPWVKVLYVFRSLLTESSENAAPIEEVTIR